MAVLGILLLLAGFEVSVATFCPVGWHRYDKACYFVIKEKWEWQNARQFCSMFHADLTVPNLAEEQAFVWELLLRELEPDGPEDGAWIRCNDIHQEGVWQHCPLRGDETNAYQNWLEGKPDNRTTGADCALMVDWNDGKWGNQNCPNPKYATCELPINNYHPLFCLQIGSDGHIVSQCLTGHVMMEIQAQGMVSCGKACLSHPRCNSFNLLVQGQGRMMCQLNNITLQKAAAQDVRHIENCYSLDL
ncbi:snaclec A10-like [Acanthaster planci]|uniref:Snaclec A10-like n=1 Tax=Acanthaster planci TaxID=133434 RepID=A0A8B7ZB50_ACAPL|nr:snaclec A10-like [Acanthaster planci]